MGAFRAWARPGGRARVTLEHPGTRPTRLAESALKRGGSGGNHELLQELALALGLRSLSFDEPGCDLRIVLAQIGFIVDEGAAGGGGVDALVVVGHGIAPGRA